MLISYRLMQFIGDHCSQIAATAEKKVQSDPELRDLQNLPTAERRNRYETILKDLQSPRSDRELASRYEEMGRTRFEDRVPLHEVMRSLMILKATIFDLIRNQGFGRNPLELYAEGELEHRVGSSVDRMLYYITRGYEDAIRTASPSIFERKPAAPELDWRAPYL